MLRRMRSYVTRGAFHGFRSSRVMAWFVRLTLQQLCVMGMHVRCN